MKEKRKVYTDDWRWACLSGVRPCYPIQMVHIWNEPALRRDRCRGLTYKIKKKIGGGRTSNIPFTLGVDTVLDLDFLDVGSV